MAKKISDETLKFNIVVDGNKAQKEYNALQKAQKKLLTETKDLEAQAKKLEKANQQNTEEYQKLTKQIQANQKEIDQTEEKMSSLTKEIGLTNLTMKQLNAESRKLKAVLASLDPETQEWQDYNKQLAAVTNRQFELRKTTRETAIAMGEQDSALSTLTDGFGSLWQGIRTGNSSDVKSGFKDITSGIKGATKAALAFIATPIGIALTALAGIAVAAKKWFDYNSAVVEALRLTTQITGLTDRAADQARIRGEALVETFGVDFKETMETAATLARQFDISFNDAFDSIEQGLVRGQKNNDEFFEALREYPTLFQNAGFSVKEFASVVEAGYDLKIYSDKLPDAIKEASISLTEQTTATRDALVNAFGATFTDDILKRIRTGETTVKDALAEISAEAKKNGLSLQQNAQLTADVFRGAGEDAGGAIKVLEGLNVALNENQRELTESEQITQQQVKATTELKQVSSALFSTGDKGFGLLIDKAKLFGTELLVDILKTGIDVYNWFVDLNNESRTFSAILTTLGVAATGPFKIIGEGLRFIKNQFNSLGDIITGIFTRNPEKIAKGMKGFVDNISESLDNLKAKAKADAFEIANAFAGNNKLERKTLEDFTSPGTTTSGGGTSEDDDLTEEDQKTLDSRKRLLELLKQFEEEQKIQEQLAKVEESQRQEEEEILRKELDFEKLKEEYAAETDLLKQLEEAKEFEIQQIKDKYDEIEFEKNKEHQEQLARETEKFKQQALQAEEKFQQAKARALNFGLATLQNVFGQETAIGKLMFAFQKSLAINDIIVTTSKANAVARANDAAIPFFLAPGVFNPAKPLSISSMIKTITANKLNAAVQIASIVGAAIEGFEQGLYPVTRAQDGKTFNASFGGSPATQIVQTPKTFLAGEMPEMIIDPATFKKMDPNITDYILQLAGKRPLQGFQQGKYNEGSSPSAVSPAVVTKTIFSDEVGLEIVENLKNLKATVVYTIQDELNRREIEDKIKAIEQESEN